MKSRRGACVARFLLTSVSIFGCRALKLYSFVLRNALPLDTQRTDRKRVGDISLATARAHSVKGREAPGYRGCHREN